MASVVRWRARSPEVEGASVSMRCLALVPTFLLEPARNKRQRQKSRPPFTPTVTDHRRKRGVSERRDREATFPEESLLFCVGTLASAPAGSAQDWEHVRVIGQRLGVPRIVTVGSPPSRSVAIGDFDGDGDADIAVSGAGARRVSVLLGDVSSPFTAILVAPRTDWPTVDADTAVNGVDYRTQASPLSPRPRLGNRRPLPQPPSPRQALRRGNQGIADAQSDHDHRWKWRDVDRNDHAECAGSGRRRGRCFSPS